MSDDVHYDENIFEKVLVELNKSIKDFRQERHPMTGQDCLLQVVA